MEYQLVNSISKKRGFFTELFICYFRNNQGHIFKIKSKSLETYTVLIPRYAASMCL